MQFKSEKQRHIFMKITIRKSESGINRFTETETENFRNAVFIRSLCEIKYGANW
jgi:hypothetical protein